MCSHSGKSERDARGGTTNQLLKCDHHDHDYHDDHDEEDVYFVDDIDDEEGVYVVDDHDGGRRALNNMPMKKRIFARDLSVSEGRPRVTEVLFKRNSAVRG